MIIKLYNKKQYKENNEIEKNELDKILRIMVIRHIMKRYQEGLEIGIDEAGRGPLFGRVYTSAVILPDDFDVSILKDSKKFSSAKKRKEVASSIREKAVWTVTYADEHTIDTMNILQATLNSMHKSVDELLKNVDPTNVHIIVDGTMFKPYTYYAHGIQVIPHACIEKGDAEYAAIAAASILAKVSRDDYIEEMCQKYPLLDEYYGLYKNKGYGTSRHMQGIQQHGVTEWHRKSFSPCKTTVNSLSESTETSHD